MRTLIISCIVILSVLIIGCSGLTEVTPTEITGTTDVNIANPAAVYCEKQGYQLETRTDSAGNQYGVCIFTDGSECDEWAYFRGECAPGGQNTTTENKAVEAAKILLAEELTLDRSQITVFQLQAMTWPDSCLGLAEPGEACNTVETPGFRVTLTAGKTNYTYHTDLTGENIRMEIAGIQG
jgi:putative hemolysin